MDSTKGIPVVESGLTVRKIDDEIIILSEAKEEIHNLTGTAAYLWNLIDGKNNREDMLNRLCGEYDVPRETALRDLEEFLSECENKQLISFAKL
jgi:hypothetical protein